MPTERNWRIVGLVPHPELGHYTVELEASFGERPAVRLDSHEAPSEYHGITYLTRAERGLLRRGLTSTGNNRVV